MPSGDLQITLAVPRARFGEHSGHWEIAQRDDKLLFDVVLHAGEERVFKLDDLPEAALAIAVQLGLNNTPMPPISAEVVEDCLYLASSGLKVQVPLRPTLGDARARQPS